MKASVGAVTRNDSARRVGPSSDTPCTDKTRQADRAAYTQCTLSIHVLAMGNAYANDQHFPVLDRIDDARVAAANAILVDAAHLEQFEVFDGNHGGHIRTSPEKATRRRGTSGGREAGGGMLPSR